MMKMSSGRIIIRRISNTASPRFSGVLISISNSESGEERYKVDPAISGTSYGSYEDWICNAAPLFLLLRFARNDGRRRKLRPDDEDEQRTDHYKKRN